jgi:hypothetical protein
MCLKTVGISIFSELISVYLGNDGAFMQWAGAVAEFNLGYLKRKVSL